MTDEPLVFYSMDKSRKATLKQTVLKYARERVRGAVCVGPGVVKLHWDAANSNRDLT